MMRMMVVVVVVVEVVTIGFLKFLEGSSNGKWKVHEAVEDGDDLGKRW